MSTISNHDRDIVGNESNHPNRKRNNDDDVHETYERCSVCQELFSHGTIDEHCLECVIGMSSLHQDGLPSTPPRSLGKFDQRDLDTPSPPVYDARMTSMSSGDRRKRREQNRVARAKILWSPGKFDFGSYGMVSCCCYSQFTLLVCLVVR